MLFHGISILFLVGFCNGVFKVDPVRLINNKTYITYGLPPAPNRTLIECPYELNPGQQVTLVTWTMWENDIEVGGYKWRPLFKGEEGTGRLKGVVRTDRDDGDLELTILRYDLGAFYSCSVGTESGITITSEREEILVVDVSGVSSVSTGNSFSCLYNGSYTSPAVFPEPTIEAGLYLESLGMYHQYVPREMWHKIRHSNGSYTYYYENFIFEFDENTPRGLIFKLSLGFTKKDGKFISLTTYTSHLSQWDEEGCAEIEEIDHKEVRYFPGAKSSKLCRGGRRINTQATMTCADDYKPENDEVMTVKMICSEHTLTWEPQGHTNTFQDLTCVSDQDEDDKDKNGGNLIHGFSILGLILPSLFSLILFHY